MKEPNVNDYAALIGIDWADKKHDVCELIPSTRKMRFSVISCKPESLNDWALSLKKRYPGKQIAVSCELKKGPLIYALSRHSHITLFPVDPSTVAKYRKAFTASGAKNDPTDASIITVIRALAFKWIRIAYTCWQTRTPYDESTYLKALKKRGSPLLKFAING